MICLGVSPWNSNPTPPPPPPVRTGSHRAPRMTSSPQESGRRLCSGTGPAGYTITPRSRRGQLHPGLAVLIATLLPLVALVGGLQPTSVAAQTEGPVITDIWLAEGLTDLTHRTKPEYSKTTSPPETIYVVVTFNENIETRDEFEDTDKSSRPTLTLTIGEWQREAGYVAQVLDNELRFSYRVVAGDEGPISVGANALRDNGNTIYLKWQAADEERGRSSESGPLGKATRPPGGRPDQGQESEGGAGR